MGLRSICIDGAVAKAPATYPLKQLLWWSIYHLIAIEPLRYLVVLICKIGRQMQNRINFAISNLPVLLQANYEILDWLNIAIHLSQLRPD